MIGIFQGSPEGKANECQRRAKGGLPRATSKKQGKRRAWQGALPKAGQFGSYGYTESGEEEHSRQRGTNFDFLYLRTEKTKFWNLRHLSWRKSNKFVP